jgi:hypothetical protein
MFVLNQLKTNTVNQHTLLKRMAWLAVITATVVLMVS